MKQIFFQAILLNFKTVLKALPMKVFPPEIQLFEVYNRYTGTISGNLFKVNNKYTRTKSTDVVMVFILLILDRIHILLPHFHCWLYEVNFVEVNGRAMY